MLERNFTNEEIYKESLVADKSKMYGFIVADNKEHRIELTSAADDTKWLELYKNEDEDNKPIQKTQVTSKEDVENIMRDYTSYMKVYDWESCIPYDGNVNSISLKDSVEEIVKDMRAVGTDYLLDVCESGIFKLKPGMELDAKHKTLYTQAVDYLVQNDFSSPEISSYYSLMKTKPCMLFDDFVCMDHKEMMALKMDCWNKRISEIKSQSKDVKNITGQIKGKTVRAGLAYKSEGKVVFNSPGEFDKQYTTAEFKEKLNENNWKISDKAPIVPQRGMLPEI